MKKGILLLGLIFSCVLSLVCFPGAVSAASAKEKPGVADLSAKGDWKAKWEKILSEARKEGRVVVYGPPVAEARQGFIDNFQKAYPGITVDYLGMKGSETAGKLAGERRGGLYLVDLYIGGTTTVLSSIREFFQPIKPLLIRPDVLDGKVWLGGKVDFADTEGKLLIAFSVSANSNVAYNTNLVKAGEITSYWDLTKPKYKGKIIYHDPRAAGKGLATATFWYKNPQLGLEYIRALAANKPVLTRDHRNQAESVARGKYAIALATETATRRFVMTPGVPMEMTSLLKEGSYNTTGSWAVTLLDKPPNPNAAAVFLNWLLSQEGQTVMSVRGSVASRRLDVPTDHLHWAERIDVEAYNKGLYQDNYKEIIVMEKDTLSPHLKEIFADF